GVGRRLAGFHGRVDAVVEEALSSLRTLGAEVVDPADVPNAADLEGPELDVLLFEFKAGLAAYLANRTGEAPRTLAEVIAFNEAHRDLELAPFGQELFERAEGKGPL